MPCYGLDEQACLELDHDRHPDGFCWAIYGGSQPGGVCAHPGHPGYLGCMSIYPSLTGWVDASTCTHPAGESDACCSAWDGRLPDGWVECKGCDCISTLTDVDCHLGSANYKCCCHFPDSNPCEGLDAYHCMITGNEASLDNLCSLIMGRASDPATMQPTGPEIYLGCRSQCSPEPPHGQPTCAHDPNLTSCALADDARIPDGWSTDCSACTPPP